MDQSGRQEHPPVRRVVDSPEGAPPSAGSSRAWWIALGVVAPVLLIAVVWAAYAAGGVWLAVGVGLLAVVVVAMRAVPVTIAAVLRQKDKSRRP